MTEAISIELPPFDTGSYEGCEFHDEGRDVTLVVKVHGIGKLSYVFSNARWFQFTQLHNCKAEWINEAYFRIVEVTADERLNEYVNEDISATKPYDELHHFRIFLEETGCYEVFAETVHAL